MTYSSLSVRSYDDANGKLIRKFVLFVLFLATFSNAGCLSDLRPDVVVNDGVTKANESRGRALLESIAEAHGGLDAWKAKSAVQVTFRDVWQGWLNIQTAMPWPENGQKMRQVFEPLGSNSRLTFLGGPSDSLTWGIQNWKTYTQAPNATPVFEDESDITFWLPTAAYFVQAPFRLLEATVVAYAGEVTIDGQTLDIVFLSWGTTEPQSDIDQYVAWIDRKTGRLVYLEYTIRDLMGFLTGCMKYDNYQEIDDIWVAHHMATVDHPGGEENMHVFEFEAIELGVQLPSNFLVPRPDLKRQKP